LSFVGCKFDLTLLRIRGLYFTYGFNLRESAKSADNLQNLIHRLGRFTEIIYPQITQIHADFKNYKQIVCVQVTLSQNLLGVLP